MSKFDLNLKIHPSSLVEEVLNKKTVSPYLLLKKRLKLGTNWKESYFNWGRNALYYLFQSLPYKTITFPGFTCPTLVKSAEKAGKKIILTEVNLDTFNLDIEKIPINTQCLVVIHTFGNPVDISQIRKKVKKVFIIEDCAHALFSKVGKNFVGNKGSAILFSLYKQIPNINGCLLLTKKKFIENQGGEDELKYPKRLLIKTAGLHQNILDIKRRQYLPKIETQKLNNYRPSKLSLFLFEKGFNRLGQEVAQRKKVARWYYEEIKRNNLFIAQKPEENSSLSYYHFIIRLKPEFAPVRDKIVASLRRGNIIVDRLWYKAPIAQKIYSSFLKKCPKALLLSKTVINLPISASYSREDVSYIFRKLNLAIRSVKQDE
ncbi:hypothetical protein COT75_01685 [Candidatus Beckwithbacteria bacterium CG10_big_fil_rev_8_21_14_0_10_34_10]|uniref:DegT/DnrJ/EryC1/StrS aminotransferase family protein n=1 Tax=Candidatus Beckwithbacteria bacterium CG10_big_fil_rev_8_21_14_0_10_34_10 TaxID=1974495 RepID=A0A2H0WBU3_9BACT|nr:MAG: hypothetical protein COT75_01685 [Candidatus Beckwithbacteria bacterium CG10_big_fil_rev_8_21_14_0_10_34_10]